MSTDYEMENHGSVWLLRPASPEAQEHAAEAFAEAQKFGNAIAVEPRYAPEVAENLLREGFTVSVGGVEVLLTEHF